MVTERATDTMLRTTFKRLMQYGVGVGLRLMPFAGDNSGRSMREPDLFRVLTLHYVSDEPALERVLRYLLEAHDVITPQQAEALIDGKSERPTHGRIPYLITFDDGFRCHGEQIPEILHRLGIKAVFFICPGIMELPQQAQRNAIARLIFASPVPESSVPDGMLPLSWPEARKLIDAGHTIGSHTCVHKRLIDLDDMTVLHELTTSAELIKERLGVRPDWFAFPYGDMKSIDARSLFLAKREYRYVCSNIAAVNRPKISPIVFRMGVDLHSPFLFQRMVLSGRFDARTANGARSLLALAERSIGSHRSQQL